MFLCLVLVATGLFMPYVQLSIGGIALGGNTSIPLYGAASDVELAQSMAARIEASPAQRIADGLLSKLGRGSSKLSSRIADVQSALQDVREVHEESEINSVGSVIKISRNLFIGILVLLAWLVLQGMSQRSPNRRRAIFTAVLMTILGLASIALFFGVKEGLALANEEIGASLLSLASGAYMMLIAASIGATASIAAAWLEGRQLGKTRTQL